MNSAFLSPHYKAGSREIRGQRTEIGVRAIQMGLAFHPDLNGKQHARRKEKPLMGFVL
jgi:hypothetical protein